MRSISRPIIARGFVALLGLAGFAGCASDARRWSQSDSPSQVVVERGGEPSAMTPAEQGRRYRAAYAAGLRQVQREQYGLAMGAFEEALRVKPAGTEALFNLAACHEAVGDPLRAIGIYRRLLEVTPDDPDCYANLGTSFIKMYHREQSPAWRRMARDAWERSLRLNPDQPMIREYLAKSRELE